MHWEELQPSQIFQNTIQQKMRRIETGQCIDTIYKSLISNIENVILLEMSITGQRRISFPCILHYSEGLCVFWLYETNLIQTPVVGTNTSIHIESSAEEMRRSYIVAIRTTENSCFDEQGVAVGVNPSGNLRSIRD